MATIAELLESELKAALNVKDEQSLHNYVTILVRNTVMKDEFMDTTGSMQSDIRILVESMQDGFRRMDDRFAASDKRFDEMIGQIDRRFAASDKRFDEMMSQTDRRFDEMMSQTDRRFDEMMSQTDRRFDDVIHSMDKQFDAVDKRFGDLMNQMNSRFNMMFFFMSAGFTILTVIMTLYRFLG